MIIFLYGSDDFRARQKLNEIIEHYTKTHKSGINLKYFQGDELNFQDFKNELTSISMFKEKKLLIFFDVFLNPEFKNKFLEETKTLVRFLEGPENILVFYQAGSIGKKDALFSLFKKQAKCQEFKPLENGELEVWVKKEIERFGKKIGQKELETFIDFVGNDLWQMENEIQKLANFQKGEIIKGEDIKLMVRPKIDTDVFKTIDAVASRDKKRALKLLKDHLEKGDSPFYLFSMINFQFRNILIIKDIIQRKLSPYQAAGLHPYVIKKSHFLSNKFDLEELKKIYQKIFRIDHNIKTGKIKPEVALDLLISEI